MQKLANIVTRGKKDEFSGIYNVVSSCDKVDANLPTLYVGLNSAKKCIENFSILQKYYKEQNCWWTFSKTERRNDYLDDIEQFQETIILTTLSKIKYEYVNFIKYSKKRIVNFIKYIYSKSDKVCFLTRGGSFIFIYDVKLKTVFGLSLTLCEYLGVDKNKVISKIRSNTSNEFINNTSFLTSDVKRIIGNNTHYILPLYCYFRD
jgi:hypothetical protein